MSIWQSAFGGLDARAIAPTGPGLEAESVRAISCTRDSHAADKSDDATWQTWRLLGRQGDLELRDCPRCGSTLGRAVLP